MSDSDNNYITMTDEEGNEFIMEHLDTLEHEDETYMAFGLVEPEGVELDHDEDEVPVVILRVVGDEHDPMLEEVVDDETAQTIYDLFMERIDQEFDEDDE